MAFSANLGFLFTELSLIEGVHAAHAAGFGAIECHFPYATDPRDFKAALAETGLPLLGLNTNPGDRAAGDFGLAALTDRIGEARTEIDRAIDYAQAVGAGAVHVMAGRTDGGAAAEKTFRDNLAYAASEAARHGVTILIEPINHRNAANYHLATVEQAALIVDDLGAPNLKIMFDFYHIQIAQGDVITRFRIHLDRVGHVQIAAVPDRGEPDSGELNYAYLVGAIREAGYLAPIGAEYVPRGADTASGLGWMKLPWAANDVA
ncbi:MAG: TIM barrel protein [Rhodobiaceae bacterium]|nr:TIM barrel protein [Rhodobiaceae bacterium]